MPVSVSKYCPLRLRVCFGSKSVSVSLRPIEPSLKTEDKNMLGYAVRSAPSALRGTDPYVFVIL